MSTVEAVGSFVYTRVKRSESLDLQFVALNVSAYKLHIILAVLIFVWE